MAKDVHLHIGNPPLEFSFERESPVWVAVRSEITSAMSMGKGTITVPRSGAGRVVFVYSQSLPIYWVEEKD